eukprot:scaffold326729_cov152-Tisochrysis_lutea.AAC.1
MENWPRKWICTVRKCYARVPNNHRLHPQCDNLHHTFPTNASTSAKLSQKSFASSSECSSPLLPPQSVCKELSVRVASSSPTSESASESWATGVLGPAAAGSSRVAVTRWHALLGLPVWQAGVHHTPARKQGHAR